MLAQREYAKETAREKRRTLYLTLPASVGRLMTVPQPEYSMVELVLIHGGERRHIDLPEGEHLLGRSPQADLVVPVPTVSRRHAMLRVKGAPLWVRDLRSAHGTEVDGSSVGEEEVEVSETSVMRIANVRLHRSGSRTDIQAALLDDADLTRLLGDGHARAAPFWRAWVLSRASSYAVCCL